MDPNKLNNPRKRSQTNKCFILFSNQASALLHEDYFKFLHYVHTQITTPTLSVHVFQRIGRHSTMFIEAHPRKICAIYFSIRAIAYVQEHVGISSQQIEII